MRSSLGLWSGLILSVLALFGSALASQQVFTSSRHAGTIISDSPYLYPRVTYRQDDYQVKDLGQIPFNMTIKSLHQSNRSESYDLTFFSDGYTLDEEEKFWGDSQKLTADIVSKTGAMYHVSELLNVWAVFVSSVQSGIGTHDVPLFGSPFGLYRPGSELRGVYVAHHRVARAACQHFRAAGTSGDRGGCDQPIILGNDPLYGGLGGEFTVITSSPLNGPIVLRHELGHSLIDVGEEYEGGEVYSGVNADKVENLHGLKWRKYLTNPKDIRIEDAKVPIQVYPWHDLTHGPYRIGFTANNRPSGTSGEGCTYPIAMLRLSLSSIPYPSHIKFELNGNPLNLSEAFVKGWEGSLDRRWLEVMLPHGLPLGDILIAVELSEEGRAASGGQGGKMLTSLEFIEYGGKERFDSTEGFIGAFPTFSIHGQITLRPTNEECLMRKVNADKFCPVCRDALRCALLRKIKAKHTP